MHTYLVRAVVVVAVCLLASCGDSIDTKPKAAWHMPVVVQPVTERLVGQEVRAGGTLEPAEVVQVTNRVSGIAETITFHAGDVVQAEQVLVAIEPERFRIAVERARAAQLKAEAQVVESSAALARREKLGRDMVPDEELVTWQSRLAQANADVALAKAGKAQAELDARDAIIRAPLSAIIESRSVKPGQFLPVGVVVATQVQRLPMRLSARVTTAEAAYLVAGQQVRVVPTAGGELVGKLVLVGAKADAGSRTVEVIAEISAAPDTVVAGGFAELVAIAHSAQQRPAIPQRALRTTERGYVAFVAVAEGDHHVARVRLVEVGLRSSDGWVEIRSGLTAGESLITVGADGIRDGQTVDPTSATPPTRH
ncbi:MAG: efflux RND transporter periplasmic adaptor subunit [Planctomycetota bacterium]